ncbi:MAG: hypothetical protein LKJ97_00095 [Succiniclasticum sp.]|jgi:hypothetical protein|nr:hypothetical protein [Succiniclasticum sp.]
MFKKTTAAILLAGMALSLPVYASDATVDEYNSEDKYASPAYHRGAEIVNDWKKSRAAAGEGTMLSETAAVGRPQSEAARRRADARRGVAPGAQAASYEDGVLARTKQGATVNSESRSLPLTLTGDEAQYANDTGDFVVQGNVTVNQGTQTLHTTKAVGNTKTGDVWLLQGGTFVETDNTMKGSWVHYNFNTETGEIRRVEGKSGKDFYRAPHAVLENGMILVDEGGETTRCPAVKHPPCLSVKARTITIVPNKRIVARDVQVFLRGVHVYSRKTWVNDFNQSTERTMPRVGWKENKGLYVSLDYETPIGNPLLKNPTTFNMHQIYYSKSHYRPFYSLRHDQKDFYVRLNDGWVYDSDDDRFDEGIWLRKKMDWGLFLKPHRIAKGLPVSVTASLTHGLWKYTNRGWSSWHTEKEVMLRHDRIYPTGDRKLYLDLSVGRKWVDESHQVNADTDRHLNTNIYHGTLGYNFSKKWQVWETYHDEHKTSLAFSLGQPDFAKEWRTGVTWRPDDHNSLTVVDRYNADGGSYTHGHYSTYYAWTHRFCCWALTTSYEQKHYRGGDNQWNIQLDLLYW